MRSVSGGARRESARGEQREKARNGITEREYRPLDWALRLTGARQYFQHKRGGGKQHDWRGGDR